VSDHPELTIDDFPRFFQSLYGHAPFRWQTRLAELACNGEWPRYIKLPTSSGKTSCLDIAMFVLAYQAGRRHSTKQPIDVPRRIFFVVDRRIIVNEAYRRANNLKSKLATAVNQPGSPEYAVAWWLRNLAGNKHAPPLDCFELRGGIYRDDAWVRSQLQPTIITSTVDQVGSRILFRGYGVSDRNLPIHAALAANDALILLDEAHCSNPFSQTMAAIARYRDAGLPPDVPARWSEQPLRTPLQFIEMTATPPPHVAESEVFRLGEADYKHDKPLDDRHGCAKLVRLVESSAKGGKQNQLLAKHLVEQAVRLAEGSDGQPGCLRIAIVVNRVACAREAYKLLLEKFPGRVDLMIGRMRPIDRDQLTKKLQDRFQSGSSESLTEPHFVVATQCLEVGADFDFDGLVSQCASLDALRQRFGRLNRLGQTDHARGVIVMAEGDKSPRKPDPIYGEALPNTWNWLWEQAGDDHSVDFGIRALEARLSISHIADPDLVKKLNVEEVNAPVLMPAHVDLLCQTGPRPALEPEIAPFLHGPNRGVPEVRVCWRADLPIRPAHCGDHAHRIWMKECEQTLAVCPPSSSECLNVPLTQFKAWLRGDDAQGEDSGDLLGEQVEADDDAETPRKKRRHVPSHRNGIIWNGSGCRVASVHNDELREIYPNSLVVLPASAGGWNSLGHVPDAPAAPSEPEKITDDVLADLARIDVASDGFKQSRDREILRIHRRLMTSTADMSALEGLWEYVDEDASWKHSALAFPEFGDADESHSAPLESDSKESSDPGRSAVLLATRASLHEQARKANRNVKMVRYPGGFAVIGPRLNPRKDLPRASFDDEFDEHNLDTDERLALVDHLSDVAVETERLVREINLPASMGQALIAAAERHDLGKADLRFQALLLNSSLSLAAMQPKLWAKSAAGAAARSLPISSHQTESADRLPRGFRHEMLSLELAQFVDDDVNQESSDLMLHAIAAHHGHARPFAPVVDDGSPPDVNLRLTFSPSNERLEVTLSSADRVQCPAHRLDSGISERFWRLNRQYGWWGLAWLETTLRLADWVASSQPSTSVPTRVLKPVRQKPLGNSMPTYRLSCVGLNGANPLGYLAALGLFQHITANLDSEIRMSWEISGGTWSPTLIGNHETLRDESTLVGWLFESLRTDPSHHWLKRLNELPVESLGISRPSEYSTTAANASYRDRLAADWLSCNGSDMCDPASNNQLQTARRDYFPESAAAIISATNPEHLARTVFQQWDYADPIQKVSLHLEPREDRRHAYQWHKPVGDPTRALRGGMVGANRLAMEAWPLFQSVAVRGDLQTVGFRGTRPTKGIYWTWPLWHVPLALCDVTPVLNLHELHECEANDAGNQTFPSEVLRAQGICTAFRLRRILVEKTPNFTAPVALFSITTHFGFIGLRQPPTTQ
jgi:CRISPR-associated endonuclease/helicase Cas3